MESKTKIPFRYIAGGCFAACALFYFIDSIYYQNLFNFYSLSLILSFAAIAVGLFLSIPMLSTAGSVLLLIYQAVVLFNDVKYNMAYGIFTFDAPVSFYDCAGFFISVLFFLFSLFIFISCLSQRSAKNTGIIAAAVRILILILYKYWYWRLTPQDVVLMLLECAGAVFLGFAFGKLKDKPKAAAVAPKPSGVSDIYEKLTHLKELLDKGIITQEDFDAKKRDILGS